jgi:hypothetical protein
MTPPGPALAARTHPVRRLLVPRRGAERHTSAAEFVSTPRKQPAFDPGLRLPLAPEPRCPQASRNSTGAASWRAGSS